MKNHETMSITNESLLKTTRGHKLKVLEPLCNQTVDLETDDKTLCCSILKTNTVDRPYIDSCLNLSTQKPSPRHGEVQLYAYYYKQQPQKSNEQDILPKNLPMDQWLFASHGTHFMNYFGPRGTQRTINQLIFW